MPPTKEDILVKLLASFIQGAINVKDYTKVLSEKDNFFKLGSRFLLGTSDSMEKEEVSVLNIKIARIKEKFYILSPVEGEIISFEGKLYVYNPNKPIDLEQIQDKQE